MLGAHNVEERANILIVCSVPKCHRLIPKSAKGWPTKQLGSCRLAKHVNTERRKLLFVAVDRGGHASRTASSHQNVQLQQCWLIVPARRHRRCSWPGKWLKQSQGSMLNQSNHQLLPSSRRPKRKICGGELSAG